MPDAMIAKFLECATGLLSSSKHNDKTASGLEMLRIDGQIL